MAAAQYAVGDAVHVLRSDNTWSQGTVLEVTAASTLVSISDGSKTIPSDLVADQIRSGEVPSCSMTGCNWETWNSCVNTHGHQAPFHCVEFMPSLLRSLPVSGNILSCVCAFGHCSELPSFRRVSRNFLAAVHCVLAANPRLSHELEDHLQRMLLSGKRVWVSVRARPQEDCESSMMLGPNCVMLQDADSGSDAFFFDKVFDGSATQLEVWSHIQPQLMRCMLRHEHACLFAYGQTGSGKTHTMFGNPRVDGEEGVAFRAVKNLRDLLLREASSAGKDAALPTVDFSFLEVYNEKVHDLLDHQRMCQLSEERVMLEPGNKYHAPRFSKDMYIVPNVKRVSCDISNLVEEVGKLLEEGAASRMVGTTVFNPRSSRSHAIATLHINWQTDANEAGSAAATPTPSRPTTPGEDQESSIRSRPFTPMSICQHAAETRLYLVDLAGSERAGQYALSAEQLKEGVNINQSLSTLGRVVGALARGKGEHVPYRDSVLTWLLSDAITGRNARAFMIAAVQPAHPAETLSTLRYAHEYSSLQSDLSSRIPKLKQQVRQLQHRRETLARDFDTLCFHINFQSKGSLKWDKSTLSERHVKITRTAKQSFNRHPYLKWIDAHDSKLNINAVGIVHEIVPIPPATMPDEDVPDGRRRGFRQVDEGQEQELGNVVRVLYGGRHGYPPVILWYPEAALEDIMPPREIKKLVSELESVSVQLHAKQSQLRELEVQFSAQRHHWQVGRATGD